MDANNEQAKGSGEMVRSLFLLLILAGAGIGALISMQIHERERRAGLMADNHDLRTELAFIEARHGEMVNFLGRPQTELVKLSGRQEWTGTTMTIAWNATQRTAVVLADRLPTLPTGMVYRLQAGTVVVGEVDGESPSRKAYSVPGEAGTLFGFEVTVDQTAGFKRSRAVFVQGKT